jgi:acyl-CoA thioester hydrolase
MRSATEEIVSTRPFVVRRRVRWGDCDPARVVYTPQFAHYVVSALDFFFAEALGRPSAASSPDEGLGFPMKALAFEFSHFLTAGDEIEMTVSALAVRQRSFDLEVRGSVGGRLAFVAKASPICFDGATKRAVSLPPELRSALLARVNGASSAG